MPTTALSHFSEDIQRARDLLTHSNGVTPTLLQQDIRRSAWMMAVGALDAYFCDAYADTLAKILKAKELQPEIAIPDRLQNLKVPVMAVIKGSVGESWRWRMAARELIEKDSVLSIDEIKSLFNQFFRDNTKILIQDSIDAWIIHKNARQRLFGINATGYRKLSGAAKGSSRKAARKHFEKRFEFIFQRRHDCIHDCDRPKIKINTKQVDSFTAIHKVIDDIDFLVFRFNDDLEAELKVYTSTLGFSGVTRNRVGI